jgi:hypothetical protein
VRFHLALALQACGKAKEAREALRQAREAGADGATLHPLERPVWEKLVVRLK